MKTIMAVVATIAILFAVSLQAFASEEGRVTDEPTEIMLNVAGN